jgi:Flp pilus assembly protein TadG
VIRDERGIITAFVATFVVVFIAVAGLVADGGRVLAARRQASDEAEAAARAGAQALDEDALRAGSFGLDESAAKARALEYLAATGHRGEVEVVGDRVRVEVSFERELAILRIVGVGPVTVSEEGEARSARGPLTGGN